MNVLKKLPVVCIRANDVSFLGLLRSVGLVKGADLFPVIFSWDGEPDWVSSHSKYFKNVTEIVNPASDEMEAVKQLVALGEKIIALYGAKALVLCSSDVNEILFQSHSHLLSSFFFLPGDSSDQSIRTDVSDKALFFNIMRKELPDLIPETISVNHTSGLSALDTWTRFPCVVKPAVKDLSQTFYKIHDGRKAIVVNNPLELKELVSSLVQKSFSLIIQEYIEFGPVEDEIPTYCLFDRSNEISQYCNCVKSFVYPEKFGTALVVEASARPELMEFARQIGKAIKWFGPLMIEFIWDARQSRYLVLEINTRPWLFHDFYRRLGLPFVSDYVKNLIGEGAIPVRQLSEAGQGVKYCDVLALLRAAPEKPTSEDACRLWLTAAIDPGKEKDVLSVFDDPDDQGPNLKFLEILRKDFGWANFSLEALSNRF